MLDDLLSDVLPRGELMLSDDAAAAVALAIGAAHIGPLPEDMGVEGGGGVHTSVTYDCCTIACRYIINIIVLLLSFFQQSSAVISSVGLPFRVSITLFLWV
jgi:hypothetical protein